jgi:polar amino acid transport system permease protein
VSVAAEPALAVERPPPPARGWPAARIAGYVLTGLWIALGAGIVLYLVSAWRPDLFARYAPLYLSGLLTTLQLVVVSVLCGAVLSVPLALGRVSRNPVFSGLAYAYVYFFRGTPLLAQTFLIYYGLGQFRPQFEAVGLWWFFREAWYCDSVGRGQWEGSAALGLSKLQTLRLVIVPQALIVALRPYGNEIVLMIKGSAIIAIITVYDLMGETRRAYSRTFDFQTYIWAALIYLAVVETLRHATDWIERRITRHLKR